MSTTAEPDTSAKPAASPFFEGDPAIIGIPAFVAASVALGLNFVGYTPVASAGTPLALVIVSAGFGLLISARWAIMLGQNVNAGIFGIFSLFWLSYGFLVLGLTHGWFGIDAEDVPATQAEFLISWLIVIGTLTLGSLRLPLTFTAILVAVDLALASVLLGVLTEASMWFTLAGLFVFIFAALGVWVYLGSVRSSTGGAALPLGKPIISD